VSWVVHGLQIRGLSWGEEGAAPLLCLHGWLDNAASFSVLAPRLENCHVVALDLTGHGRSSWRSDDATYQIWDDLPEIQGVVDALGWETFNLLGHSRGATMSTLLASSLPARVRRLVLLDGIAPPALAEEEFPAQLARFLKTKGRLLRQAGPVYATVEAAVQSRVATGLGAEPARLLTLRNLCECEGGYTWTTDPRLRGASAVKLTAGQIQAVLKGLVTPTLLLAAQEGYGNHPQLDRVRNQVRDLQVEQVPGQHHFHMESGVDTVAERILRFLDL
jgi:pimeloyl-ACP methyl ester carboxylesterase